MVSNLEQCNKIISISFNMLCSKRNMLVMMGFMECPLDFPLSYAFSFDPTSQLATLLSVLQASLCEPRPDKPTEQADPTRRESR
jgi:hypothetical protein